MVVMFYRLVLMVLLLIRFFLLYKWIGNKFKLLKFLCRILYRYSICNVYELKILVYLG